MASSAQKYLNFDYISKTVSSYAPTVQTQNAVKAFLWNNKEVIIVSAFAGLVIWKIVHYIRNRPQMPDVEFDTSVTFGRVTIKIPKKEFKPPDITLTFCVDLSDSMAPSDRSGEVKRALKILLNNAQQAITKSAEAKISIAITGFTHISKIITHPTPLTHENKKYEKVIQQVDALVFHGGTRILVGFEGAAMEAEKLAKANPLASHYVVFLTDGVLEDHDKWDNEKLSSIQKSLAAISAKVFAVGIGEEHSKKVLRKIAKGNRFNGTYIDTTKGKDTIANTIAAIYNQAISSFQELELSSSLPADTWSVNGMPSRTEKEQSNFSLGTLEEGKTLTSYIVIHGNQLKDPLDLSTVFFNLTFKDPKGRKGELKLDWNPTTFVDPAIAQACHSYR